MVQWTLTVYDPESHVLIEKVENIKNIKAVVEEVNRILEKEGYEPDITEQKIYGMNSPSYSGEKSHWRVLKLQDFIKLEKAYFRNERKKRIKKMPDNELLEICA